VLTISLPALTLRPHFSALEYVQAYPYASMHLVRYRLWPNFSPERLRRPARRVMPSAWSSARVDGLLYSDERPLGTERFNEVVE